MRQLARLLLALVVVPGLLLPQGGTYCLMRLFGIGGDVARTAKCDGCCARVVRAERRAPALPDCAPRSNGATNFDACCLTLPEIGGTVDSNAKATCETKGSVEPSSSNLFDAPADFAASLVAAGRFDSAWRAPPSAPRPAAVPIALPLRL